MSMKRRLCKGCREALGVVWATKGRPDCVVCTKQPAPKRLAHARDDTRITAHAIGGQDQNGNRDTDGWEYI